VAFEGHFGDIPTVVTLCAQLTRDLLAIAKFLALFRARNNVVVVMWLLVLVGRLQLQ